MKIDELSPSDQLSLLKSIYDPIADIDGQVNPEMLEEAIRLMILKLQGELYE